MNVAILHSHFCRGGVTQVVENHVAALADQIDGQIVLVSGGRNDGLNEDTRRRVGEVVVPAIDYDAVLLPGRSAVRESAENLRVRIGSIADAIVGGLAEQGLDADSTLLHWHNHGLGKNVAVPGAIERLTSRFGFRQLLQIHDFAEDFRPSNYRDLADAAGKQAGDSAKVSAATINRYLYPFSDLIHYATLTSGDAKLLSRVGLPDARCHVLPNSVTLGDPAEVDRDQALQTIRRSAALPADAAWCLYPVRGIRRKNVGEFLLLSRLLPEPLYAGITLPPATEIERRSYQRWQAVGREVAPRAVFDAGTFEGVSFLDNLAASRFILSTSVAEGFGMAFLEPWLLDRGVIARRLPDVVVDFEAAGLNLNRFYDAIWLPGETAWIAACRSETAAALRAAWPGIDGRITAAADAQPLEGGNAMRGDADGVVDFATLTSSRQIEVLRRMRSDRGFHDAVCERNAAVIDHLSNDFDSSTLRHNRSAVASAYSLATSAERLAAIYRAVWKVSPQSDGEARQRRPVSGPADVSLADVIVRQRTFYPCRTETEINP